MWDNQLRQAIYFLIYQELLSGNIYTNFESDGQKLSDLFGFDVPILAKKIIDNYHSKKTDYLDKIKVYFVDWNKTFDIVKSILITYLLETESLSANQELLDKGEIITNYIRFAQDFTSNQNVKLVHAILIKLSKNQAPDLANITGSKNISKDRKVIKKPRRLEKLIAKGVKKTSKANLK